MTDLASSAFSLACRGYWVFPLAAGSKVPIAGTHGFLEANRDPDVARAVWHRWPKANIGVATGAKSGFWALDIDAPTGIETFKALIRKYPKPSATRTVLTPNGGLHLWFEWTPDGPVICNSASKIGPGLDVRGEGGYITAPPSRLADRPRGLLIDSPPCAVVTLDLRIPSSSRHDDRSRPLAVPPGYVQNAFLRG